MGQALAEISKDREVLAALMEILETHIVPDGRPQSLHAGATLALALAALASRERYLALERPWWRYDVGVKYGLLSAQISLALSGTDRDQVLTQLLELLALRELQRTGSDSAEQHA